MAFETLLDQDHAKKLLEGYIRSGRIASAYLFTGPDGVGKQTAARLMAQAINCEEGQGEACGRCQSCVAVAAHRHPDLIFYRPERGSLTIGIDQIRRLKSAVSLKPSWTGRKVAVIAQADRMTQEAANALLKTLEEPPDKTVIILTASSPEALPQTIVSRCQLIPFRLVKQETIQDTLVQKFSLPLEQAELWAFLAHGRLGVAMAEAESGHFQLREMSLECILKVLRNEESPVAVAQALADVISQVQNDCRKEAADEVKRVKEEHQEAETSLLQEMIEAGAQARHKAWVERLLDSFVSWFRDALVAAYDGTQELVLNRDHKEEIQEICHCLERDALFRLVETALLVRERLASNVQIKLLLERLFLDISGSVEHARSH